MTDTLSFTLDGETVSASPDETIWNVANRLGEKIPHLCHLNKPGYEPSGNCRACMVEVNEERVLAASCVRKVQEGMVVKTQSERAKKARKSVFQLLIADQPSRITSPDSVAPLWQWAEKISADDKDHNPYPSRETCSTDPSHPAINVNLNACISCGLCVQACRDVQHNDVIGLAFRGAHSKIIFDLDDPMGKSTCVGCGECVQACPTGALIESSLVGPEGTRGLFPDKSINTLCPYCGVGCQVTAHVKDNNIISIDGRDGPANSNRLCVKGRFGYDYISHPDRLTSPLRRKKDAPKNPDSLINSKNINDFFEPISWEVAMEETAKGFLKIRDNQGPQALAGFGSAKGSNEEAYLFQKLIRTGFGTNNVDHCTRLCHASSVAALMENLSSGAVSAPFNAVEDSDFVIVIGARPNVNHPVAASFIKHAALNHAKLVIMDPRKQALSRFAWQNLHFTPGQDVALLNAMIHVIINENLCDEKFIASRTSGFELLKDAIQPYAPETMAEKCGIDAETIREVARAYARAKNAIIFWGMGVSQHAHGTQNARCLIALALITGHIGKPGTGLHPLRGQNNVQGASDAGLIPMTFPDYQLVADQDNFKRMEKFWNSTNLDKNPGLTVVEIINQAYDRKINGLYVMGENPAMSDPDTQHARAALARLDHLVVQDIFLTETACFADIILPSSALMEKLGTFTNTNRQIQMGRPVVNMPGIARQDLDIINEIGQRLGLPWQYHHPSIVFDEMCQIMPSLENVSWERIEKEDSLTYPVLKPNAPGEDIIFKDQFPTPDGLGKIPVSELLPPAEIPDNEYPFILTTGRLLEHWHTGAMTRRSTTLDTLEPIPHVHMNPQDIKRLGLSENQNVRICTRRGHINITVRKDQQVALNMIFIPFCFREAAANILTNPVLDPFGKIPEFKYCAARIETNVSEPVKNTKEKSFA
jgi:formate dehydrogenase major subunit